MCDSRFRLSIVVVFAQSRHEIMSPSRWRSSISRPLQVAETWLGEWRASYNVVPGPVQRANGTEATELGKLFAL